MDSQLTDKKLEDSTRVSSLRAGIIGAGRMGITHLAIAGSHPGVTIAAVADQSAFMTRTLKRYRPDIGLFADYRDMLARAALDIVLIATPPDMHAAMIDDALDAGLSIFVEKPLTLSGDDARRIVARTAGQPRTYQVGYVNRFNDMFQQAKRLVADGVLGRLFSFRSDMFGRTVTRAASGSGWRGRSQTGGGCLYEFGSHAIDLMVFLLGKPRRVTGSCLTRAYSRDAEDIVRTNVIYDNELTGSITVNWSDNSCRKPTNKIEILGEHGKLLVDQHEMKLYMNRPAPPFVRGWNRIDITESFAAVPFYVRGNEFTRQIYYFVDRAIDASQPNLASFSEAALTQEVIDMVLADAGAGSGDVSA
jgi:predicted dehydrogenase